MTSPLSDRDDPATPILPVTGPSDVAAATLAGMGLVPIGALAVARRRSRSA